MPEVKLLAISTKGKQLLIQHGEWWKQIKIENRVSFSREIGPWLLLSSLSTKTNRWINADTDADLLVLEVKR